MVMLLVMNFCCWTLFDTSTIPHVWVPGAGMVLGLVLDLVLDLVPDLVQLVEQLSRLSLLMSLVKWDSTH